MTYYAWRGVGVAACKAAGIIAGRRPEAQALGAPPDSCCPHASNSKYGGLAPTLLQLGL